MDRTIRIGKRVLGAGHPAYLIYEVASTHGNDWERASRSVAEAAASGADAVKFQLFEADKLITPLTTGLQGTYEYLKANEMPREWLPKLKALCDEADLDLLCTPFDAESAEFLDGIGLPAMKVSSGDLTNPELLGAVAGFGKPVILSTGMATMEEIERAISVLTEKGAREIVLLQCVSVYPTSFEDANVSAMDTLRERFGTLAGYSDNGSEGVLVPLLAALRGAAVIEKHVTGDRERGGIDDVFSLSAEEFAMMARRIRDIERRGDTASVLAELRAEFGAAVDTALGDGVKRPAPHGTKKTHPGVKGEFVQREEDERRWARRGLYPVRDIRKGEVVTRDMLVFLRPDIGLSANAIEAIAGREAGEDLPARLPLMPKDGSVFRFRPDDAPALYPAPEAAEFVATLRRDALFS